jgi:hypothetical protein
MSVDSVGLFHRAVSQSGTAFCSWSLAPDGSSKHQAQKLAALLDCPTQPSSELVSCLRTKDAVDITSTDRAYMVTMEHLLFQCTLAETKIGLLVYANGRLGGTAVTITLLFAFIIILLTVRLPTQLEQTKSVCAIIYLYVKKVLCLKR